MEGEEDEPRPGTNPSALQPKTLGFALRCAGRGVLQLVSLTCGSSSAITRHGCGVWAPRERGHPLAVVNTRTVKSATLGREGGFQDFAPRVHRLDRGACRPGRKQDSEGRPVASQLGALVWFISLGEGGDGLLANDGVAVDREA